MKKRFRVFLFQAFDVKVQAVSSRDCPALLIFALKPL